MLCFLVPVQGYGDDGESVLLMLIRCVLREKRFDFEKFRESSFF